MFIKEEIFRIQFVHVIPYIALVYSLTMHTLNTYMIKQPKLALNMKKCNFNNHVDSLMTHFTAKAASLI